MLDILLKIDNIIFQLININLNYPLFDYFFVFFHDFHKNLMFIIPLLTLWFFSIFKDKKRRLALVILIPLAITITDQIGSYIKDYKLRDRPYMAIESNKINLLVKVSQNEDGSYKQTQSSQKSFPSNHSANIWALSLIVGYLYSNVKTYFIILASLISISRVYIGVHYPLDIIFGAIIGISVSSLLIKIYQKLIR
tara:strand:- start:3348 stop:3932 length:585 start_codon:yes stop_codon:yes gene_type:complete